MNAKGKKIDKTHLSIEHAMDRRFIHRDYIAHCLRWSHVCKLLTSTSAFKRARVLDVGCGKEMPLARALYSMRYVPIQYFGVDYGEIPKESMEPFKSGVFQVKAWDKTDFCNMQPDHFKVEAYGVSKGDWDKPNWVTCFEVLEHVEPAHMLKILRHIKLLADPDATILISTPCWNVVDCADNHVNEIKFDALGAVFEQEGFRINAVNGTFASISDYKDVLTDEDRFVFEKLRSYFDTNVLSNIFAPLYPSRSRNCLWNLSPNGPSNLFPKLKDVPEPWGSSQQWKEMQA